MDLDVRITEPHEMRVAADTMRHALLFQPTSDTDWEQWSWGWTEGHVSATAWDGDECVGNASSIAMDTKVPGGSWIPTAGITRVGVKPTHTRRGALTRMMHLLLQEERRAGKMLASLRASEAVIYPRYGFGLASEALSVVVDPIRIHPITGAAGGTFRTLAKDAVLDTVRPLYDRIDHRVGAVSRSPFLWGRYYESIPKGEKPEFVVVHTSADGRDDGYVYYRAAWTEHPFRENLGTATILEMFADNPAVELALWQFVANISLVREIVCDDRPHDDPLRFATANIRAYEVKRRWDEQWLRLLDVEAALAARTYGIAESVTIAVRDPWFPDNSATFRVGEEGVDRVSGGGELTAGIAELSAAYMGSVRWADLVAVSRVDAASDEAVARADRLFAHAPATWCGSFY
jgi:predicted acetyltransferase